MPHERLIVKLSAYGIFGNLLKWILDRVQTVRMDGERSGKAKVLSDIPQDSILGPILLTVFINDLPSSLKYLQTILNCMVTRHNPQVFRMILVNFKNGLTYGICILMSLNVVCFILEKTTKNVLII